MVDGVGIIYYWVVIGIDYFVYEYGGFIYMGDFVLVGYQCVFVCVFEEFCVYGYGDFYVVIFECILGDGEQYEVGKVYQVVVMYYIVCIYVFVFSVKGIDYVFLVDCVVKWIDMVFKWFFRLVLLVFEFVFVLDLWCYIQFFLFLCQWIRFFCVVEVISLLFCVNRCLWLKLCDLFDYGLLQVQSSQLFMCILLWNYSV